MKHIKMVMFDLDGVLVDACDWHYEALNQALLKTVGYCINRQQHESTFNGLPTNIKLKMLGISDDLASEITSFKQKFTMDIIRDSAKPMSEKIDLHTFLKEQGIHIACVTNSIRMTAIEMLKRTGQLEFFDLIVSNEDVQNNKPNPDCYNYTIEKMNIDPSLCVCVEDSPKGIRAALDSRAKWLWKVVNSKDVTLNNYRRFVDENFDSYGG
jgi:beta-phosphoglucomutase